MSAGFLPPLIAEVRADATQYQATMAKVAETNTAVTSQGAAQTSKMASIGGAALLGLGAAFTAVGVIGVKFALDAEVNQARLRTAIQNTGHTWGEYADDIDRVKEKSRELGFTGGDVTQALTKLVNVTHDTHKAVGDMSLAEDIARGRNIDLAAATDILVKVESGRVGMLGRLGINVKDNTGALISQHEALKRLSEMYGGQAQAYSETFRGKMATLEAQAKYLVTAFGQMLLPVITDVAGALADGVTYLDQHREAAIALAVVIGGPLVAAMVAWIAMQVKAMAIALASAWETLAIKALYAGEAIMQAVQSFIALGPAAMGAFGALFLLAGVYAYFASTPGIHEQNAETAALWFKTLDAGAKGSGKELSTLQGYYKQLGYTLDAQKAKVKSLTEDYASHGMTIDQANEKVREMAPSIDLNQQKYDLLQKKVRELVQAHKEQLVETQAVAKATGIDIPGAAALGDEALKQLRETIAAGSAVFDKDAVQKAIWADKTGSALKAAVKDSQDFANSIATAFAKTTDPFAHFGNQTEVTESQMEQFFVGSNLKAQEWSNELGGVIQRIQTELPTGTRNAVTGLVQEMAKAGPDSKPALDAFIQMVNEHGVQWVNDMAISSENAKASVIAAYNAMAIDAAIRSAEIAAVGKAAFQDLQEGGTAHIDALLKSHDTNLAAMAYGTHLKVAEIQAAYDSTHGHDVKLGAFGDIPARDKAQSDFDAVHGHDVVFGASVAHGSSSVFSQMAGQAATAVGNIFWKRGGTAGLPFAAAGMTLRGPQLIVAGEAGPESVLPLTRYGDMVTTIRNSGYAAQVLAAAAEANGWGTRGGGSSSGGHGGGEVHYHTHHHNGDIVIKEAKTPKETTENVARFLETGRVA